jgi:hypothetical protein
MSWWWRRVTTQCSPGIIQHYGRWFHIKLPGLVCNLGFMNQGRKWYGLNHTQRASTALLSPLEESDVITDNGLIAHCPQLQNYILGHMHSKVEDVEDLSPEMLGMRSAEKAICVLSRYTNAVDDRVKKALARLSIIVCESAKTHLCR